MASEAEIVEARLRTDAQIGARTAMTRVARAAAGAIGEVVVAFNTPDGSMLFVRESHLHGRRTLEHGPAQSDRCTCAEQTSRCDERNGCDEQHFA
jgi:hypothetical protein